MYSDLFWESSTKTQMPVFSLPKIFISSFKTESLSTASTKHETLHKKYKSFSWHLGHVSVSNVQLYRTIVCVCVCVAELYHIMLKSKLAFGEFSTVCYTLMVQTDWQQCEFSVMASVKQQKVAMNRSAHDTTVEEQEVWVKEDRHDANAIQKQEGSAAPTTGTNEREWVCANREKRRKEQCVSLLSRTSMKSPLLSGCGFLGPEWF